MAPSAPAFCWFTRIVRSGETGTRSCLVALPTTKMCELPVSCASPLVLLCASCISGATRKSSMDSAAVDAANVYTADGSWRLDKIRSDSEWRLCYCDHRPSVENAE